MTRGLTPFTIVALTAGFSFLYLPIVILIVFRPGARGKRDGGPDSSTSVGVDGSGRRDKNQDNDNDNDGGSDGGGDGGGGGGD